MLFFYVCATSRQECESIQLELLERSPNEGLVCSPIKVDTEDVPAVRLVCRLWNDVASNLSSLKSAPSASPRVEAA